MRAYRVCYSARLSREHASAPVLTRLDIGKRLRNDGHGGRCKRSPSLISDRPPESYQIDGLVEDIILFLPLYSSLLNIQVAYFAFSQ